MKLMLKHCICIALCIAWAQSAAAVARQTFPAYALAGPPIQLFFARGPMVDGLPVVYFEWRVWNGREWLPLVTEQGQEITFGVKPVPLPAPPIPKHQRRLE